MIIKIGIINIVYWGKGKLVISSTCVLDQITTSNFEKICQIAASKVFILYRRFEVTKQLYMKSTQFLKSFSSLQKILEHKWLNGNCLIQQNVS